MAKSLNKSSEFSASRISSTILAERYSRPIIGVISSNSKAASSAPLFFNGAVFLLFRDSGSFVAGCDGREVAEGDIVIAWVWGIDLGTRMPGHGYIRYMRDLAA
jgi:hypothetical protein